MLRSDWRGEHHTKRWDEGGLVTERDKEKGERNNYDDDEDDEPKQRQLERKKRGEDAASFFLPPLTSQRCSHQSDINLTPHLKPASGLKCLIYI